MASVRLDELDIGRRAARAGAAAQVQIVGFRRGAGIGCALRCILGLIGHSDLNRDLRPGVKERFRPAAVADDVELRHHRGSIRLRRVGN